MIADINYIITDSCLNVAYTNYYSNSMLSVNQFYDIWSRLIYAICRVIDLCLQSLLVLLTHQYHLEFSHNLPCHYDLQVVESFKLFMAWKAMKKQGGTQNP